MESEMSDGYIIGKQYRRAITPNPEKMDIHDGKISRRAITPTPNRPVNEYQNLEVIQRKILTHSDVVPNSYANGGTLTRQQKNGPINNADSYQTMKWGNSSTESNSSGDQNDGFTIPDQYNQPRRRDSGNWSGDRNSASSSSSTTLENPYHYIMSKRHNFSVPNSSPKSPTKPNMGIHQQYDAGYDSYSVSSTDSYPSKNSSNYSAVQKMNEIPTNTDPGRLCREAHQLLEKSRITEEAQDLETALVLCRAAAAKTRAAMNVPYSDRNIMSFARMKHNMCIMRARSIYRKILLETEQQMFNKNGSADLADIPDLVEPIKNSKSKEKSSVMNNIEIYATLPKRFSPMKLFDSENVCEEKPRESRSLFSRSKKDKRSRSEERNKVNQEFSAIEPGLVNAKDTLKKQKEKEKDKKDDKNKDKANKKQHKIRRKLLMGGLIKRKNRSMPDLTEGNNPDDPLNKEDSNGFDRNMILSTDDSALNLGTNTNTINGYLSEGHFDCITVNTANPNLERSKLMRKSFHGSGRQLTVAKVPPMPPVRMNSTLSQQNVTNHNQQSPPVDQPDAPVKHYREVNLSNLSNISSNTDLSEESCQTIITCAVVHQEQSPQNAINMNTMTNNIKSNEDLNTDGTHFGSNLELPPYPSPPNSSCHSRQASEDFPPPPPSVVEMDNLNKGMEQLKTIESGAELTNQVPVGNNKFSNGFNKQPQVQYPIDRNNYMAYQSDPMLCKQTPMNTAPYHENVMTIERRINSILQQHLVKQPQPVPLTNKPQIRTQKNGLPSNYRAEDIAASVDEVDCVPMRRLIPLKSKSEIDQNMIAEEIREVEMLNAVVHDTLNNGSNQSNQTTNNIRRTKKKSVSFCDQVILVATADEDEEDNFIPNPILERVLRTAASNGEKLPPILDMQSTDDQPAQMSPTIQQQPMMQQPHMIQNQYVMHTGYQMKNPTMNGFQYKQQMEHSNQMQQVPIRPEQSHMINGIHENGMRNSIGQSPVTVSKMVHQPEQQYMPNHPMDPAQQQQQMMIQRQMNRFVTMSPIDKVNYISVHYSRI